MLKAKWILLTVGVLCNFCVFTPVKIQGRGQSGLRTLPSAKEDTSSAETGEGKGLPYATWARGISLDATPSVESFYTPTFSQSNQRSNSKLVTWLRDNLKSRNRNAPERQNSTLINLGSKYFNAIIGGIERGAGINGGLEVTTADTIPDMEFRVAGHLSTRLYRAFEATAFVPKLGDEKTHAEIMFTFLDRAEDRFYGIGPDTTEINKTTYRVQHRMFSGSVFHSFTSQFEAGAYVRYTNTSSFRGENQTFAPIDTIFSGDPNAVPVSRFLPGLFTGSEIITYGIDGELDRRNRDKGLLQGMYLYGNLNSNDGLDNGSFSDYGWIGGTVDGRVYIPLMSAKTSLAVRAYTELKHPKGGSQIPFYFLSYIGGQQFVRGYSNFRFAGNNLLLGSVELRQTVYARSERSGVDVFAFGDSGQVWGDNRSDVDSAVIINKKFDAGNWKSAIGGGIQLRASRRFAVRMAVGHSNEGNRLHFSFSPDF